MAKRKPAVDPNDLADLLAVGFGAGDSTYRPGVDDAIRRDLPMAIGLEQANMVPHAARTSLLEDALLGVGGGAAALGAKPAYKGIKTALGKGLRPGLGFPGTSAYEGLGGVVEGAAAGAETKAASSGIGSLLSKLGGGSKLMGGTAVGLALMLAMSLMSKAYEAGPEARRTRRGQRAVEGMDLEDATDERLLQENQHALAGDLRGISSGVRQSQYGAIGAGADQDAELAKIIEQKQALLGQIAQSTPPSYSEILARMGVN